MKKVLAYIVMVIIGVSPVIVWGYLDYRQHLTKLEAETKYWLEYIDARATRPIYLEAKAHNISRLDGKSFLGCYKRKPAQTIARGKYADIYDLECPICGMRVKSTRISIMEYNEAI